MRRFFFLIGFLLVGLVSYSQGNLRVGVNAGIPVGDISDFSDLNIGADVAYLVDIVGVASVGPMVGYSHFMGKDDFDDVQFLPIAASGRIGLPASPFFLGADLGYAVGLKDGVDGGFYYRPKIGFNLVGVALTVSYSGISVDGGTFSTANVGVEFGL